jgi:hypothetical protein
MLDSPIFQLKIEGGKTLSTISHYVDYNLVKVPSIDEI